MATVIFNQQKKLKILQSKIFLKTNIELTQQEILEFAVDIIDNDIDLIVNKLIRGFKILPQTAIQQMLKDYTSDWGEGSENSSSEIDEALYS